MRFHGHYFTFSKKNWLHACVYHYRMKPTVGRNFTSERGEGVKGEVKNISLHWLQGIFETVPYRQIRHTSGHHGSLEDTKVVKGLNPCDLPGHQLKLPPS